MNLTVTNSPTTFQTSVTLPPSFRVRAGHLASRWRTVERPDDRIVTRLDDACADSRIAHADIPGERRHRSRPGHGNGLHISIGGGHVLVVCLGTGGRRGRAADRQREHRASLTAGVLDSSHTSQGDLNIGYVTSPGDLNDWSVTVPQGGELSLALTNLPATYDLALFGPSGTQLQGNPNQTLGGVTDTLPTLDPGSTSEPTPGSQDVPVTPPAGDTLEAISNNPDAQSQYIQTTPLAAGTYVVQVSGYNGSFSTQPYLLQANILGGATAPSCPDGISYLGSLASVPPSSGPVTIPSGANTLFLVDTQRLSAAFGSRTSRRS